MARFLNKREESLGKAPGSVVFIGNKKTETTQIRLIDYNKDSITEKVLAQISEEASLTDSGSVSWINIDGLHDVSVIHDIGTVFSLHPLVLDDIANTSQRPGIKEYDNCIFIVLKMVCYNEEEGVVISEQLSLVVGKQFLITFQEQPGTVFDPVRERVRSPKRRIRGVGSDFLAYSLLDTVVDNYLHIIERIGEQIEELEEEVMGVNDKSIIEKINLYRSEMNYLRKAVRPAREMIIHLKRMENDIIQESTLPFLNALLDLLTEASEAVEVYREMLSDTMTLYNTRVNLRMNDIMKVLTIFAAIFIPLTFIAGIYGTNFAYVPEYHYKYSYFIFWAAIVSIALSMVAYFKHKNWF